MRAKWGQSFCLGKVKKFQRWLEVMAAHSVTVLNDARLCTGKMIKILKSRLCIFCRNKKKNKNAMGR